MKSKPAATKRVHFEQHAFFISSPNTPPRNPIKSDTDTAYGRELIKQVIAHQALTPDESNLHLFYSFPKTSSWKIKKSKHSGKTALVSDKYQIILHQADLIFFEKRDNSFVKSTDHAIQEHILNQLYIELPEQVLLECQIRLLIKAFLQLPAYSLPSGKQSKMIEDLCQQVNKACHPHLARKWSFGTMDANHIYLAHPLWDINLLSNTGFISVLDNKTAAPLRGEAALKALRTFCLCFPNNAVCVRENAQESLTRERQAPSL